MNNLRGFSGFREMLTARQQAVNSLVCVGLDPLPERLPACIEQKMFDFGSWAKDLSPQAAGIVYWMYEIVRTTAPSTSMFKPQKAHWEAFPYGQQALAFLVNMIHLNFPDIPVFLDCFWLCRTTMKLYDRI